jgi:rhamnulokinase
VKPEAQSFVAVDLGASGGRVVRGRFGADQFEFEEVRRNEFRASVDERFGTLRRNAQSLRRDLGGAETGRGEHGARVVLLGVDTWGVDRLPL